MSLSRRALVGSGIASVATMRSLAFAASPVVDLARTCRCNGSDPDDDGIAKAMAMLPPQGGLVLLPPQALIITRPLVVQKSRVTIAGTGPASRLITRGDVDGIVIANSSPIEHLLFHDFEIAGEQPRGEQRSFGVRFQSPAVNYPEIRSVTVRSKYGGIAVDLRGEKLSGASTVNALRLTDCNVQDCYGIGLYVKHVLDLFLSGMHIAMRRGCGRGIVFSRWVQAVHATRTVCLGGEHNLHFISEGARSPSEVRFSDSVFDGATNACILLDASSRTRITNSWISSPIPGASAVVIGGPGAVDTEFDDCDILNVARNGVWARKGSGRFRIENCRIFNCSYEKEATYDGVNIEEDSDDWEIERCVISNKPDYKGRQRFGINIARGAVNYRIIEDDLRNNGVGGLSDAASGEGGIVKDNYL